MKPFCSIIIPAYNAEKTISSVLMRLTQETWKQTNKIIVINDGSNDNTVITVNRLKNKFPNLELYSFNNNQGYGRTVSKGIELCLNSECNYVVCLHADGQYPPEKIVEFLSYMHDNNIDILQGSRHKTDTALTGGMPFYKYIAGKSLVWLENLVFDLHMTDYHSGFMFYSRNAIEQIPFNKLSNSFDFDLEMIALGKILDLKISELGIPTRYADEKSYLNPFAYGVRVLRVLYRYRTGFYKKYIVDG